MPKSRPEYWGPKIERNRLRDKKNVEELQEIGWSSLTAWECELAEFDALIARIERFLHNG